MIHDIPLMRSLDPHHARLGYLGTCAAVAVRSLDTSEALIARMRDLLFERYYAEEPEFQGAVMAAEPGLVDELLSRSRRTADEDPAAILAPLNTSVGWLTRSEKWLYDRRMPSHVGYLQEKHVGRTVDLARWTGVLLPTLDLSEDGLVLRYLVTGGVEPWNRETNLLLVQARPALVLMYLRLLLKAELLFPVLLCEFADRSEMKGRLATRGANGLLRAAVARLRCSIGEPTDPEDVLSFSELAVFETAVLKSQSTEENYLRPRLEMLVDLGILSRRHADSVESPGAFPWSLSESGIKLARDWRRLADTPQSIDEFLDKDFIRIVAASLGLETRSAWHDAEGLLWFARAYAMVGRDIGFTPGRTVAQLASIIAAENGVRLEIADIYRVVYALPAGQYAAHASFSGGSRFDTEFMIKLSDGMLTLLEDAVGQEY